MRETGPPRIDPWTDERYRVETPERIDLEYEVAGLGSRFLASLIDSTIVIVTLTLVVILGSVAWATMVSSVTGLLGNDDVASVIAMLGPAILILLIFVILWGYFLFFELVWHGQTPGKRWVGLRVIKEGGYPVGFTDVAIRNVIRLVDFLPVYYAIGVVVMFIDRRSRRLGDLAAGTIVVKERRELQVSVIAGVSPSDRQATPASSTETGDSSTEEIMNLRRLTADDRGLVREYHLRRSTLGSHAAAALAERLAVPLARKLDYDLAGQTAEQFLSRLSAQLDRRR